jgi:hypothetical protein
MGALISMPSTMEAKVQSLPLPLRISGTEDGPKRGSIKVPLLQSPSLVRGKGIFVLHRDMSALDFAVEPSFECANDNASDVTFVNATCSIGSRDAVEEYLACGLLPLSTSVKNNTTSI